MPHPFAQRIALLGCPSRPTIAWDAANLGRLRDLGFTGVQLNIAWGARPGDEALNLEDVVDTPAELADLTPNRVIATRAKTERRDDRISQLQQRASTAKAAGLRTVFHFGAPFMGLYTLPMRDWSGQLARCLTDGRTQQFYVGLLRAFADAHPDVDDLWLYTFDQDAWICSEFGSCTTCRGIPLHERLPGFVDLLSRTWRTCRPDGRVWWEPWELSAGQVYACVERLDPASTGLALHGNIAEAQATLPVDRWLRNTCDLAQRRGFPVVVEHFLGAASEELEPLIHLSHPQVTWRALRRISEVAGVGGIKEYFGLLPDQPDPNLAATSLFFTAPDLGEEAAMTRLAGQFASDPTSLVRFWDLCSQGMEAHPWDLSWFAREIGHARPDHALSAAIVRGFCADSPSWRSTRGAVFMRIDNQPTHPWLLEDIQLRCLRSASFWEEALVLGRTLVDTVIPAWRDGFARGLADLDHCRRVALSYAYHCRATNLANLLREADDPGQRTELAAVLAASAANAANPELDQARQLLDTDPQRFLATWLLPTDGCSRGAFTVTSA
jgi:hypothetical protein